jgi:hypothetical protein
MLFDNYDGKQIPSIKKVFSSPISFASIKSIPTVDWIGEEWKKRIPKLPRVFGTWSRKSILAKMDIKNRTFRYKPI